MSSAAFYRMPHQRYESVIAALEEAGLPIAGLDDPNTEVFGMSNFRGPIGYVALEGSGADRLLRSLVILPHRREAGFGRELIDYLEVRAALESERLHLLTTSAAPFFRRLGYGDADRATAPAAIAATDQFRSLCPANAAYLVKELR